MAGSKNSRHSDTRLPRQPYLPPAQYDKLPVRPVSPGATAPPSPAVLNGFVDRAESTLSADAGTRTFTITPVGAEFRYWSNSVLHQKTAAESVQWDDLEGSWYFYYDGADLYATQTFLDDLIQEFALVALIYWDAANNAVAFFGDERHGYIMDPATHSYLHTTRGAVLKSGCELASLVTSGNGNAAEDAQVGFGAGSIADEDINHVWTAVSPQTLSAPAQIPVYYRSGALGYWRKSAANDYPMMYAGRDGLGGTRAYWNEFSGGTWGLTEAANGDYLLMHFFATNSVSEPIIAVVGQATYPNAPAARDGAAQELLDLQLGGIPTAEFVAIYSLLGQTSNGYSNVPKVRWQDVDSSGTQAIDWRTFTTAGGSSVAGAFLPLDGSEAMTGDLDMGGQAVTNVGLVDGRDVSVDGAAQDAHLAATGDVHGGHLVGVPYDIGGGFSRNICIPNAGTVASLLLGGASGQTADILLSYSLSTPAQQAGIRASGQLYGYGVDASSQKVTNVATPTAGTDGANKTYVDSAVAAAAAIFPIWAEENGTLAEGLAEWSFGDGASPTNGVVIPFACECFAMSLSLGKVGTAGVELVINGTGSGYVVELTSSQDGYTTFGTPKSISAGDAISFKTDLVTSSFAPCHVTAWFRTT